MHLIKANYLYRIKLDNTSVLSPDPVTGTGSYIKSKFLAHLSSVHLSTLIEHISISTA